MILCSPESWTEMHCGSCVMSDGNGSYVFSQGKCSQDLTLSTQQSIIFEDMSILRVLKPDWLLVLFSLMLESVSW